MVILRAFDSLDKSIMNNDYYYFDGVISLIEKYRPSKISKIIEILDRG